MRGPGRTPALFALESAMDELAVKLNLDPVEVRLRNYAEQDEGSNLPWSSKHLREAYQRGAERFGWSRRNPKIGSMTRNGEILGWGMATCTWPGHQRGAEVRVRLLADGSARASCATQDIGTGTYTVFAEIVSDKTGLPVEKVHVIFRRQFSSTGPDIWRFVRHGQRDSGDCQSDGECGAGRIESRRSKSQLTVPCGRSKDSKDDRRKSS